MNDLFEGMEPRLASALADGYRAMFEGIGDARKAEFIHNGVLPAIYNDIISRESLNKLYRMVRNNDEISVTVSTRPEFSDANGNPLTVRFTRNNIHPQYVETVNAVVYPIMPYMAHGIFRLTEESGVRGKPQSLKNTDKLSFTEFCKQLDKSWKTNTAIAYDKVPIKEGLMHELTHWFDYNFRREQIFRKEKVYPWQDRTYKGLLDREAAGGTVDKSYYEWKDKNLRPVYRGTKMAKEDADILARARGWTSKELMNDIERIKTAVHENERMGRKSFDGISEKDKDLLTRFTQYCNRYNYAGYTAASQELNARIVEQIPWLVDERQAKKGELPMNTTLSDMLDRVFDVPPPADKERRAIIKKLILPGALRSAARRCARLIDAVNHMECPEGEKTWTLIGRLISEMEKGAQPQHVARQM